MVSISNEFFINNGYGYDYCTIWVWELLTFQSISCETLPTKIIDIDFCRSRNYITAVLPLSYFEHQAKAIVHKSQVVFWQFIDRKLTPVTRLIYEGKIRAIALHPNLECLAVSDNNKVIFLMQDSQLKFKNIEQQEVYIIAFSQDGSRLAIAVDDLSNQKYTVSVWDIVNRKEIICMPHEDILYSLAFSPDGKYLAVAGRSRITHVWGIDSGQESTRINHNGFVQKVVFSPVYDGSYLLTNSSQIWKLDHMPEVACINYNGKDTKPTNNEIIKTPVLSPDCKYLAIMEENTVQIWDVINGNQIVSYTSDELPVNIFCFSPDGEYIATVSKDNILCVRNWKFYTSKPLILIKCDDSANYIRSAIFSLGGNYLAVAIEASNKMWKIRVLSLEDRMADSQASPNKATQVWEMLSREEFKYISYEETDMRVVNRSNEKAITVNAVNLSWDGANLYLATATSDGTTRIWNVVTGDKIAQVAHENID